ncbi:MAG: HDIG domain-containing protein [Actinobacteria bacterium]|nr:HDIG domain-containing protein [Actinomycetota bacterium]
MAAVTFLFVVAIISVEISPFGYRILVGKPSPRDIVAPRTVQYIDEVKTDEQRESAAEAVQDVYVRDNSVAGKVEKSLEGFFAAVEQVDAMDISVQEKVNRLVSMFSGEIDAAVAEGALSMSARQRSSVQEASLEVIKRVMEGRVTGDTMDRAAQEAEAIAVEVSTDPAVRGLSVLIAASFIQPNSVINEKETEKRREAARDAVTTVVTTWLEGEVIVEKEDVVTARQVALLKSLGFKKPTFTPINLLYFGMFALLLLGMFGMYLAKYRRVIYDSPGLLFLLGVLVVVFTALAKIIAIAAGYLSPSWGYIMPAAVVAIVAAVLMDTAVAIVLVIICSLVTGVVTGGNYSLTAFVLLGGFFPTLIVSGQSSRHELRWAGVYTSLWVALAALGTCAITQFRQGLILNTAIGFANGFLCMIVAMGLLPFLETTFRVTTSTRLLELASPEQELLKELSMKAPGTYSHSVMVANLAEAAAREIGGDPMLARVAAYYHDVGKLKRLQFFIENQPANSSPHNRITPNLSALVITSHVKDGVEMVKRHHLPPDIVDIIEQHHGTSVVRFFYDRAVEAADGGPVDLDRFRYHFPKPRRRTAGILLLADAVEATARTLNRPSSAAIEQMVNRIVDGKIADGQLDESGITFSDVNKIRGVFSKILISAYHPRIEYPAILNSGGGKKGARKGQDRGPPGK